MKREKRSEKLLAVGLILAEMALLIVFFSLSWSTSNVIAVVGTNATVQTKLNIGNVYPEVINVSIDDDAASVTLTANDTTTVQCYGVLRDYNGEDDMWKANATFYGTTTSSSGDTDDNNYHYTNTSCVINTSFGSYNGYSDDAYHALAECTFEVEYYALAEPWECDLWVEDMANWTDNATDQITVDQLLAVGLPDVIDYGTVNATYVSNENETNITNYGNVFLNLSLEGYGAVEDDGYAFNCSLGNVQNISVEYEKYNLTASNPGDINHSQMIANYTNLTSGTPNIEYYNLTYRTNDSDPLQATKQSWWRVWVPIGVAGNCTGNIIFGATTANAN